MLVAAAVLLVAGAGCSSQPEKPKGPPTWDGLELVAREGLDTVYVRPGASLSRYRRVMLRHAEVSFDKNWKPFEDPALKAHKVDPNKIAREVEDLFQEVTVRELQKGSYQIVSSPDDDVLRVVPVITDLAVTFRGPAAPDSSDALVVDAGHMTLVVELRESLTNTILARVIDRAEAGSGAELQVGAGLTGSAAAEQIMTKWAVALRSALDRARALPPGKESPAESRN
jgi:hypothetical protein